MSKVTVSKIRIYPIKSLGYVEVEEIEIGVHSLKNDRRFAMVDGEGRYINGKRTGRVNQLKTEFDLSNEAVKFFEKPTGNPITFELKEGNAALNNYLSNFFDVKLKLVENKQGKLMDVPVESSVTIVSEASLQFLQKDIDRHTLESMRLRFRTNIELTGVEAFWEEKLYQKPGVGIRFRMGEVEMIGVSPRARCNVPPQNPDTGEMDYYFVKNMIKSRNGHATVENLLTYGRAAYFLTINTFLPKTEIGKRLKLNDKIQIIEPVMLAS